MYINMNVLVLSSLHSVLQSRLLLHFGSSLTTHIVYTGCPYRGSPMAAKFGKNSPLLYFGVYIVYNSASKWTQYGACPNIRCYSIISVEHIVYIQLPANMSLLNEFMCGPLDIQDIKGETDAEAEHGTGSLPDRLINPEEYANQWYSLLVLLFPHFVWAATSRLFTHLHLSI